MLLLCFKRLKSGFVSYLRCTISIIAVAWIIHLLLASFIIRSTTLKTTNKEPCQFTAPSDGPLPVILMATGRSGSSVTWDTMAQLTGDANVAYEVTGGNVNRSRHFFDEIHPDLGSSWPIQRLCHIQKRIISQTNHSGIVGFQWKPYSFDHIYAAGALEEIAKHRNPSIRVIFLTRNWIDRRVSNLRHKGHIRTHEVPAHCKVGDDECVQKHKKLSKNITLPTGQDLITKIEGSLSFDNDVEGKLARANVKYVKVTYEELFYADTATEWMKIFQLLERGPAANLTMDRVRETFSIISTSSQKHQETISNYNEVKNTLNGTHLFHLLH